MAPVRSNLLYFPVAPSLVMRACAVCGHQMPMLAGPHDQEEFLCVTCYLWSYDEALMLENQ